MKTLAPYTPKPARGVSCKGYIRVTRSQLAKVFTSRPGWTFDGFIVGNNVNPFHFFGGWHLACPLTGKTADEMAGSLSQFEFYLDRELGNRAAIFIRKSSLA